MLHFCTFPGPSNNLVDTRYAVFKGDRFYCAARKDLGVGECGRKSESRKSLTCKDFELLFEFVTEPQLALPKTNVF